MSPGCCSRVLGVPRVWIRYREGSLGLVNDKEYYVCVVIRTLERLGVEDRACGYVASGTSKLKGKKAAPEYVVRLGLSVPYVCMHCYVNVINHVVTMGLRVPNICISCREMVLLRHGTCDYRPKGVGIIICALGRGSATGS